MNMKKKLLAMILAAMMLTGSMGMAVSANTNVPMSQSLSTTQKKVIVKKKKLTEKQLIQLMDEQDELFICKEMNSSYLNKKTNELELEVVKKVSPELQKKIDGIKKKYGISVKVQIVDDYEGMLTEYEIKQLTEEQITQLYNDMNDLFKCSEVIRCYINENNELEIESYGSIAEDLQSKADAIENKYGIKVIIGKADGFGDWLREYKRSKPDTTKEDLMNKMLNSSKPSSSFDKERHIFDFADYVRTKLGSQNYSYVRAYADEGKIEVGVPSVKAMEQAMNIAETYREAKGIKYTDYLNPEKFVDVKYRLCKYSYSDILKAYNSVLKDSFIKKNRANGNIYSVDKIDGCLYIRYNEKTKEMEKWRDSSKYKDMIVFEEFIKRNLE